MPPSQNQQKQYEFIMNPGQAPKKGLGVPGLGGGSLVSRILVVAVIAMVLIIGAAVGMSALNSSKNAQKDELIKLVATQARLINITDVGSTKAHNPDVIARLTIVKLSVQSDQNNLVAVLKKQGVKIPKGLTAAKDTDSVAALNIAEQNNQYDDTLNRILTDKLAAYQKQISEQYKVATTQTLKDALTVSYDSTSNILGPPAPKTDDSTTQP